MVYLGMGELVRELCRHDSQSSPVPAVCRASDGGGWITAMGGATGRDQNGGETRHPLPITRLKNWGDWEQGYVSLVPRPLRFLFFGLHSYTEATSVCYTECKPKGKKTMEV